MYERKYEKTKVMISGERQKPVQKAARWLCSVCGRGVGSNSIQCTSTYVYCKHLHFPLSGFSAEMMQATEGIGTQWLLDLCNGIVKEGCIPED